VYEDRRWWKWKLWYDGRAKQEAERMILILEDFRSSSDGTTKTRNGRRKKGETSLTVLAH